NGETPIFLASLHGHAHIMRSLLMNDADIMIQSNELVSTLVAAVKGGNQECLKICIEQGMSPDSQDAGGWTALHEAAYVGDELSTEGLLAAGAKVDITNTDGATPLFTAAQYGIVDCLKALIKHKANL
ncbi:predicted protein, partial [Nematostella vectensis]